MIAGGSSEDAVTHGVRLPDGDGVHIREGMGFFELGMLDQHFLARGRIGRILVSALQENSPQIGLGIDEVNVTNVCFGFGDRKSGFSSSFDNQSKALNEIYVMAKSKSNDEIRILSWR